MLKSISKLTGVNILGKEAQKNVSGGYAAPGGSMCGVIVTYPGSSVRYVVYTPDENGNGLTKDEAIYTATYSNTLSNNNGGYVNVTGNWCCDSCSNFPSAMA